MSESCGNCAYCYRLKKLDYSQGGCIHTNMDGYICMAFADEGITYWMVGNDLNSDMCEAYTPKEK